MTEEHELIVKMLKEQKENGCSGEALAIVTPSQKEINRRLKAYDNGTVPCPKCGYDKVTCIFCDNYIEG